MQFPVKGWAIQFPAILQPGHHDIVSDISPQEHTSQAAHLRVLLQFCGEQRVDVAV